ncbi:N-acetylglucosamine kinase [Desertivirga brevis]|uniref:N-acetylglucosamine kinase n=1 Tax=Desertivirga brevis TaxID=2810310 RepID=UPI001A97BCD9|nr:N-acetylglucosamine kinase [Pedobacter sp. SYSU D00873]
MILIADSGSTKTTWSAVEKGREVKRFETEGYNPYFVTGNYIANSVLKSLDSSVSTAAVEAVYYYGAGCDADRGSVVQQALSRVFWRAEVFVSSDMLAAARGTLGAEDGFVAILGTGSNTCLYSKGNISINIDSLGFILGDEGSGAYLGKRVLQDYLRNTMPTTVRERFQSTYSYQNDQLIYNVYSAPLPNRFCATFSKFLINSCDYSHRVIKEAFKSFFLNLVSLYPDYKSHSFNCVGSVGFVFADILTEVSKEFEMQPGKIVQSPMDGLIEYHLQKQLL